MSTYGTATYGTETYAGYLYDFPRITGEGLLGCGSWEVAFAERGGSPSLFQAAVGGADSGLVNDGVSNATIRVPVSNIDPRCTGDVAALRAWEHEVKLIRDGQEVWVGPIADRVQLGLHEITVRARDLGSWFDRRTLPFNRNFGEFTDLSTIFQVLASDAMVRDPSPNISFNALPSGLFGARSYAALADIYAGDALRELARDAIDWTMSGRTMRIRGPMGGDPIGPFITSHFDEDLSVSYDGLDVSSEVILRGGSPEGSNIAPRAVAGGVGPRTGLVQQVHSEGAVTTQPAADAAARQLLRASGEPSVIIEGTLTSDAPVDYLDLLPGNYARLELDVGGTHVSERCWLVGVRTSAKPGEEQVRVTFSRGREAPPDAG